MDAGRVSFLGLYDLHVYISNTKENNAEERDSRQQHLGVILVGATLWPTVSPLCFPERPGSPPKRALLLL